MLRAERERVAIQQQLQAAVEVAGGQLQQLCVSQLQHPPTPSVVEQHLCTSVNPADESEQHSHVIHSPVSLAFSCNSIGDLFEERLLILGDVSRITSVQCQSAEGEEEVCTWDPEALVVIESF
jgi:hypothetical protein